MGFTKKHRRLKTTGVSSCAVLVTRTENSSLWSFAHIYTGTDPEQEYLVQLILTRYESEGILPNEVIFEIYHPGPAGDTITPQIQDALSKRGLQPAKEDCRWIHTGCFLYDSNKQKAIEICSLNFESP